MSEQVIQRRKHIPCFKNHPQTSETITLFAQHSPNTSENTTSISQKPPRSSTQAARAQPAEREAKQVRYASTLDQLKELTGKDEGL